MYIRRRGNRGCTEKKQNKKNNRFSFIFPPFFFSRCLSVSVFYLPYSISASSYHTCIVHALRTIPFKYKYVRNAKIILKPDSRIIDFQTLHFTLSRKIVNIFNIWLRVCKHTNITKYKQKNRSHSWHIKSTHTETETEHTFVEQKQNEQKTFLILIQWWNLNGINKQNLQLLFKFR